MYYLLVVMFNLLLKKRRLSVTSSHDNSNLSEGLFAQRMEIHRDKRRGVLGLSQKAYLEKESKEI